MKMAVGTVFCHTYGPRREPTATCRIVYNKNKHVTLECYLLSLLAAPYRAALPALCWSIEVYPVASPTTVPWHALAVRKAAGKQINIITGRKKRHLTVCWMYKLILYPRHFAFLLTSTYFGYYAFKYVGKGMSHSPLTRTLKPMFLFVALNI